VDGPDPAAAAAKYERLAPSYDRRVRFAERYRRRVVERLLLRPGQRVLDVGCGTGLAFELLLERVGPGGQLVGVDLSSDMLAIAARRVERAGAANVTLIRSAIEELELEGEFDAALFFLTHDVLQSEAAVENVVRQLNPGGRVASFGPCQAYRWLVPVNLAVRIIARPYVTTLAGLDSPWRHLARRIPDLTVESVALGGAYIAAGTVSAGPGGG
jgi:ubiquinone/menaquinone biosynthesis C-methylase UbiE